MARIPLLDLSPDDAAGPFDEIEHWKVYVVGTNHCWGRGDTLSEAMKNASRPKHYVAYLAHPDTTVDNVAGGLLSPRVFPPKLIDRKLPAKRGAYRR